MGKLSTFVTGVAVGVASVLLANPKNREKVAKKAKEVKTKVVQEVKSVRDQLRPSSSAGVSRDAAAKK